MPLKFYDKPHLSRNRDSLPQIQLEDLPAILLHFRKKGVTVTRKKRPLNTLSPAQHELNKQKIIDKLNNKSEQWRGRSYVCGKDYYLVDGQHDYAQGLEVEPECEVLVYRVNLPTKELIRRLNLIKLTKNKDLRESQYKQIINIIK